MSKGPILHLLLLVVLKGEGEALFDHFNHSENKVKLIYYCHYIMAKVYVAYHQERLCGLSLMQYF